MSVQIAFQWGKDKKVTITVPTVLILLLVHSLVQ